LRWLGVYLALNVVTVAFYLPWLSTAWEQITNWPNTGEPTAFADALSTILGYLALGITVEGGMTAAVAFFLIFGLLQLPEQAKRNSWQFTLIPVIWVIVSVGAFLWLDLFREANLKFLLPAQVGVALWVGRGVWTVW
jgi:hypothetical protein